MIRPPFLALLFVLLLSSSPGDIHTEWKESGWISTCAGVGCTGWDLPCFSYTIGGTTRYCYLDI